MPTPVFSHILGTIALIGIMTSTILLYSSILIYSKFIITKTMLSEVANYIASEITDVGVIYSLGSNVGFYRKLYIPKSVGGHGYAMEIVQEGDDYYLKVYLETIKWVMVKVKIGAVSDDIIYNSDASSVYETELLSRTIAYSGLIYSGIKNPVILCIREDNGKVLISLGWVKD